MWYRAGTISIANGATTVTGSGTYWAASIMPGDSLIVDGKQYEIASVQSDTQLTLVDEFSEPSISEAEYAIIVISTTTSGLATRITNVASLWQQRENEIAAWQAGTVTGGPNSNGKYPLTSPDGVTKLVYCPAAIASLSSGASDWADTPEDEEVPGFPGRYSSLHWASKSEDSAVAAAASEALVSPHYTNIDTVATNIADVNTVAGMAADITAVIADASDIGTVAGMSADIAAVIADASDIGTVALNIGNVNTVAGMSADITAVIADSTDIGTVAGMSADITVVIADSTDIGTVATNISSVNSVASSISNVNTVASISSDIGTVVINLSDIQDAPNQATLAQQWATAGEDVLVNGVGYSAYHWAQKAEDLVTGGVIDDLSTSTIKTWSSTKIASELSSVVVEETDPIFTAWDKSTGISITESQISDFGNYEPADATILKDADIGVTVQGYDANLVSDASYVHTDNNYTTAEKTKLSGIAEGAEVNVQSDWNAVDGDALILNKPTLGTAAAQNTTAFEAAGTAAAAITAHETAYDHSLIGEGGDSFPSLTGNAGKFLQVSSTETGVEWGTGTKRMHIFSADTVGKNAVSVLENIIDGSADTGLGAGVRVNYDATSDLFYASRAISGSYVATSPDALTWTLRSMPSAATWTVVTDGVGWFALAEGTTTTAKSTDGITWTSATSLPSTANVVIMKGSRVLAFTNNSTTAYSSDDYGDTWDSITLPEAFSVAGVTTDSLFLFTGNSSYYYTSSTGGTGSWEQRTKPSGVNALYGGLSGKNSSFDGTLIYNSTTNAYRSEDGITWTPYAEGLGAGNTWLYPINGIVFSGGTVFGSCKTSHKPGAFVTRTTPYAIVPGYASAKKGSVYAFGSANGLVAIIDPINGTVATALFEV